MKNIKQLWDDAITRRYLRQYKNFYLALDLHGTLVKSTYYTTVNNGIETENYYPVGKSKVIEFFPYAIEALKEITRVNVCKIILWTSSDDDKVEDYITALSSCGIGVSYINENPNFKKNSYANFSKKFCFDILFDDKAGFDPENDWKELYDHLIQNDWGKFYRGLERIKTLIYKNSEGDKEQ